MSERRRRPVDAKSATVSRKVEIEAGQKRGRNRSRGTGTTRRIQRTAQERQAAWLETEQAGTTYRLTRELDGLYGEHRDEQAGTLTDPFYGRTMKAGRG